MFLWHMANNPKPGRHVLDNFLHSHHWPIHHQRTITPTAPAEDGSLVRQTVNGWNGKTNCWSVGPRSSKCGCRICFLLLSPPKGRKAQHPVWRQQELHSRCLLCQHKPDRLKGGNGSKSNTPPAESIGFTHSIQKSMQIIKLRSGRKTTPYKLPPEQVGFCQDQSAVNQLTLLIQDIKDRFPGNKIAGLCFLTWESTMTLCWGQSWTGKWWGSS